MREPRMDLLKSLQERNSTHSCPECGGPAYCAMEAGKPFSECWCSEVPVANSNRTPHLGESVCMCRNCLTTRG